MATPTSTQDARDARAGAASTTSTTTTTGGLLVPMAKRNRNKKSLVLSSSTAKPGTLTGITPGELLLSSNTPVQVARRSPLPPSNSHSHPQHEHYHNRLSEQLSHLELGLEFKVEMKDEDLSPPLRELGAGNGGMVEVCQHLTTRRKVAKKTIHIPTSPSVRKQILRELQILHDCNSPWIVSFYGAYLTDLRVVIVMEWMDKGSLDSIYRALGPIPEPILGAIARAVVEGLCYLYEGLGVMHRDVKPSNILLNSLGQIKICDFGVSGELINSVADTFVGTSTYMSPERISGDPYTVKSDVWSLGITLVELALGRFPFCSSSEGSESESERSEDDDDDERKGEEQRTMSGSGSGRRGEGEGAEDTLSPVRPGEKDEALAVRAEAERQRREDREAPGPGHQMSILELLQYIVNESPPSLPTRSRARVQVATGKGGEGGRGGAGQRFSQEAREFVDATLRKEPVGWNVKKKGPLPEGVKRPTPKELLEYPWMQRVKQEEVDLVAFARSIP